MEPQGLRSTEVSKPPTPFSPISAPPPSTQPLRGLREPSRGLGEGGQMGWAAGSQKGGTGQTPLPSVCPPRPPVLELRRRWRESAPAPRPAGAVQLTAPRNLHRLVCTPVGSGESQTPLSVHTMRLVASRECTGLWGRGGQGMTQPATLPGLRGRVDRTLEGQERQLGTLPQKTRGWSMMDREWMGWPGGPGGSMQE